MKLKIVDFITDPYFWQVDCTYTKHPILICSRLFWKDHKKEILAVWRAKKQGGDNNDR